jgi:hypothetical protein
MYIHKSLSKYSSYAYSRDVDLLENSGVILSMKISRAVSRASFQALDKADKGITEVYFLYICMYIIYTFVYLYMYLYTNICMDMQKCVTIYIRFQEHHFSIIYIHMYLFRCAYIFIHISIYYIFIYNYIYI